jgi:hypothetical protein
MRRTTELVTLPHETPDLGKQVNRRTKMADGEVNGMAALGELICRLNPYTELPQDKTTGLSTGEMEVVTFPKDAATVTNDENGAQVHAGAQEKALTEFIAGIAIEVEGNYGEKWSFKGQAFAVKTAVRIPYRFPVYKNGKLAYWQTENLLIGYAGNNGP